MVGAAPRPLPGDAMLHHWSVTHRPGAGLALARAVTATGTGVIPFVVVLLAGLCVHGTVRRRAVTAAALALCPGSGQALRYAVMALVSRPRPPRAD
ncbi:hypothetical protein [Streptomyces sp. NBC_01789]|uniref:hypothetical protein n=1 Tax=Streptomyces sp. NBC_01789 TaxID=2975941 RepID=UPI002252A726|nr:hypothetical protein [Streptomyces sp. NBC_01789]MCX4444869.1 hypothetical protein [Streptomyces sp. NBC_01789]